MIHVKGSKHMNTSNANEPIKGYELLERAAKEGCQLSFVLFADSSKKKNKKHNRSMLDLMSLLGESEYQIKVEKDDTHVYLTIENDGVKYMYEKYIQLTREEEE
jgi:hypothetical protein